jgi:hypothetical protein
VDEKTIQEGIGYISVFSKHHGPSKRFIRLDDESAYCVLGASAFLGHFVKMHGCEQQRLFGHLLDAGVRTESDLRSWMAESSLHVNTRRWDLIRKRAQEFLAANIEVFVPAVEFFGPVANRSPAQIKAQECSRVLFGKGCPAEYPPLVAVFNSRKPRLVSPDSIWLHVMRCFLHGMNCADTGLAGSAGTITYDLASTLALRQGVPQFMILPFPLFPAERRSIKLFGEKPGAIPRLSCMLDGAACPGKQPMRCRDRLLAGLSDLHLILEIRSGGNLLAILKQTQSQSPRPQLVLIPDTPRMGGRRRFFFRGYHARG